MTILELAADRSLVMGSQEEIITKATERVRARYGGSPVKIKNNFSRILSETETEAHKIFRIAETEFGSKVLSAYFSQSFSNSKDQSPHSLATAVGNDFAELNRADPSF